MNGLEPGLASGAPPATSSPLVSVFRRVLGPETTALEARVVFAGALAFTGLVAAAVAARAPGWGALQWALAIAIAFDFGGGVIGNATRASARWSHRPGQSRARAIFYAGHVHPVALAWAFETPWAQAAALYGGMLAAAAIVELAPRAVARPVAFGAVALGLVIASAVAWPCGSRRSTS